MTSWLGRYFKRKVDRSEIFGYLLMAFGAVFSEYSFVYFSNISLVAVGISSVIVGAVTTLSSGGTIPGNIAHSLIMESYSSIEELLKQFDAHEPGIYLPPRGGKVFAFAPLGRKPDSDEISKVLTTPIHTLIEVNGEPGLVIFFPVTDDILTLIKKKRKIEPALKSILVDQMKLLKSLKVREYEDKIVVSLIGSTIESHNPITEKIFGSIPASISGCIISFYLNKPLGFTNESRSRNVSTVSFEVARKASYSESL